MSLYEINPSFLQEFNRHGISRSVGLFISLLPMSLVAFAVVALALPFSRPLAITLLLENNLVEMLTFVFFLLAAIQSMLIAASSKKNRGLKLGFVFLAFSILFFVISMEEISWGQQFFNFDTPSSLKNINEQGELTIHNIRGIQHKHEYFHIIFFGTLLFFMYSGRKKSQAPLFPSLLLLPWILSVLFISIIHVTLLGLGEGGQALSSFQFASRRLTELSEMLMGLMAMLYMWTNMKAGQYRQELAPIKSRSKVLTK
jgi:hypothetical protein